MNTDSTFRVIWRGNDIGLFTVTATDHQYWEGPFAPNGSMEAERFQALARPFDIRQVYAEWEKGTRVELYSNEEQPTQAVVLGLDSNNMLLVRFAYAPEAIDWIQRHVY